MRWGDRRVWVAVACAAASVWSGFALAARVECKPNVQCDGTRRADVIIGTDGIDNVSAKRGADLIRGRQGDDNALRGDKGRDTIRGGFGQDHLVGGSGLDVLKGGADFDYYVFDEGWGKEQIVDTPIVDADINTAHEIRFDSVTSGLVITMTSGPGPEVRTLDDQNTLDWDADLVDRVIDGEGSDVITGRGIADNIQPFVGGADNVQSGGGDDLIYSVDGAGNDAISCGAGTDYATVDVGESVDADCETVNAV